MLTVFPTSPPGVTRGIGTMLRVMQDNRENLIVVIQVDRDRGEETIQSSFVAVFREKGTIAQIFALVNEWGTNYGLRAGGTGMRGYGQMRSFIADFEVPLEIIEWDKIERPELERRLKSETLSERLRGWAELVELQLQHALYDYFGKTDYPINDDWQRKIRDVKKSTGGF